MFANQGRFARLGQVAVGLEARRETHHRAGWRRRTWCPFRHARAHAVSVAEQRGQVKTLPPYPDAEVRIPPGHAWVEGTATSTAHSPSQASTHPRQPVAR